MDLSGLIRMDIIRVDKSMPALELTIGIGRIQSEKFLLHQVAASQQCWVT